MKNFKNLITLLVVALAFHGCESDMDIVVDDPRVLTGEQLFTSPTGYKQALAGVYGNLSLTGTNGAGSSFLQGIDAGTSQFGRCMWYLQNLTTDEVIWSYENDEGVAELQRGIWTANNPILLGMFSRTMVGIAIANDFLRQSTPERLSERRITAAADVAEINIYRDEVRAVRAYYYYMMMDLFGKAPFVTEQNPASFAGTEYNRVQLFEYVEKEMLDIIPTLKAPRTNEYGRVDKSFAWAVLAKIYLNSEVYTGTPRYTQSMTMCSNIIGAGYQLKTNYLDNFKADNNTSNELLFTLQSDGVTTQNFGATTVIINGQVGSVEGNGVAQFGVPGWGGALRLRRQFVEKFNGSEFDFDSRKTIVGAGRPIDIANIAIQGQGFVLAKWSNRTVAGIAGPSSTFVNTDFPLFRLADFYLMYAEAQMRQSGATNANNNANANALSLSYVNALRERANDGNFANVTTNQLTLSYLLDERARELHWEGHRRQDLIRHGKFSGGAYNWAWKGNIPSGGSIGAFRNVFPIPSGSLTANKNLTQNLGY